MDEDKRDDEAWEETEWEEGEDEFFDEEEESIDDVRLGQEQPADESAAGEQPAAQPKANVHEADEHEAEEAAPVMAAPVENLQPLNMESAPVHVSIEVGRLQMSAQQLMQLTSGNLLDLHVQPESGVDLVVNNQLVGRGELVQVGESLGVRILEVAK